MGLVQPEVEPHQSGHGGGAQRHGAARAEQRQGKGQQQAGAQELGQVVPAGVVGPHGAGAVQKPGNNVGVGFHPRVGAADRGGAQVLQTGGGGAHQHDLPLQAGRGQPPLQHVGRGKVAK